MDGNLPPISLAGAGRLAAALGRAIVAVGAPLECVWARDPVRGAALAADLGVPRAVRLQDLGDDSRLVILAVSDRAIPEVAGLLGSPADPDSAVIHCSGASGIEILGAARAAGWLCAACHPLMTFAGPSEDDALAPFRATPWAFEAEPGAAAPARALVAALGGRPFDMPGPARPLYHAACVISSNYTVALQAEAVACLVGAGVPRAEALGLLLPLVKETVRNLERAGLPGALTGPAVRHDKETMERHLAALPVKTRGLYQVLAEAASRLAAPPPGGPPR